MTALRLIREGAVSKGVRVPVDQPGGGERMEFRADFRWLPAGKARKAVDSGDEAFLRSVLAGWSGIERADGSPLEVRDESYGELADAPHVVAAVSRAYMDFLAGSRAKNSPG